MRRVIHNNYLLSIVDQSLLFYILKNLIYLIDEADAMSSQRGALTSIS